MNIQKLIKVNPHLVNEAISLLKEIEFSFLQEELIEELYGKRCTTQDWHCPTCRAYKMKDDVRQLLTNIKLLDD